MQLRAMSQSSCLVHYSPQISGLGTQFATYESPRQCCFCNRL